MNILNRNIPRLFRNYHKVSQSFWSSLPVFAPSGCRLQPTCSEYSALAIERYGLVKGLWRGVLRVIRCNPLTKPHVDLP